MRAVTVGQHAPASFGQAIVDIARQAFMAGSDRAMLVAVVAATLGSLVAARFLPARATAPAPEPVAEVEPVGFEEASPSHDDNAPRPPSVSHRAERPTDTQEEKES